MIALRFLHSTTNVVFASTLTRDALRLIPRNHGNRRIRAVPIALRTPVAPDIRLETSGRRKRTAPLRRLKVHVTRPKPGSPFDPARALAAAPVPLSRVTLPLFNSTTTPCLRRGYAMRGKHSIRPRLKQTMLASYSDFRWD